MYAHGHPGTLMWTVELELLETHRKSTSRESLIDPMGKLRRPMFVEYPTWLPLKMIAVAFSVSVP